MSITTIVTILVILALIAGIVVTGYLYLRNKSMEEIRADVYQLFLDAEHTYVESEAGKQKMKYVITLARSLLPKWISAFITDEFMEKVIQIWFDAVKDLLDDGKYNHSVEEER